MVTVTGEGPSGDVARMTLRRVASDDTRASYTLTLPDGEIQFMRDGSVGRSTLPSDWTTSRWEALLLASFVDRTAAEPVSADAGEAGGGSLVRSASLGAGELRPRVVANRQLVNESRPLVNGCRAAMGEATYWTAAQAALACSSPGDGSYRAQRPGFPYTNAVVQSGNFEPGSSRCAGSTQALAGTGDTLTTRSCPPGQSAVQLVSWGTDLVRSACLAGVAAASAGGGALTYWVCAGGAAVLSGGGCTLVAPGVGTVACGVAGGVVAAPACGGGALAVAAGAAAAGLTVCNVAAPASGSSEPASEPASASPDRAALQSYADAIPGEYPCKSAFNQPEQDCGVYLVAPPGWAGPFHRLTTSASGFIDKCAAQKCELWGAGYRGSFPCAMAFRGPLPEGQAGFEFYTNAGDASRSGPSMARWCAVDGSPDPNISGQGDYGAIRIAITKTRN
jgi:hypothetical protein